jgi:hypothetical protein
MKAWRSSLIIVSIVAILLALSFFEYQKSKGNSELSEHEEKIITFPHDDFNEIIVHKPDLTLHIKKSASEWEMLEPVQDRTDDLSVSAFLLALSSAKVQPLDKSGESVERDWTEFGLNPGITFDVKSMTGASTQFLVSQTSAFDGSFYVRKGNSLFVGDRSLAHLVEKTAKQLRDHTLWRSYGELVTISVRKEDRKEPDFRFKKD